MKAIILSTIITVILSAVTVQANELLDTTEISKSTATYGEAKSVSRAERVKLFKGYADNYYKKSAYYKGKYKNADSKVRRDLYSQLSRVNRALGNEKANMAVAFERNDNSLLKSANANYIKLKDSRAQLLAELHEEEIQELKQVIAKLQAEINK